MAFDEIGRHPRQRIITVCYPVVFDRDVLALDVAHFGKATAECSIELNGDVLCQAAQITNHRHCRLLRPRPNRPRHCRAAKQRDEVAAPDHSITSSAMERTLGEMVRPSALSVLALITSSNSVACHIGRSAGLAPLRMRPT